MTSSTNLPTINADDASFSGYYDIFLTGFSAYYRKYTLMNHSESSGTIKFSTYVGGNYFDYSGGISLYYSAVAQPASRVFISGITYSTDLPVLYPIQYRNTTTNYLDGLIAAYSSTGTFSLKYVVIRERNSSLANLVWGIWV